MTGNQNLVAKIIINAQDNASKTFQSIQDKAGTLAAALVTYFSAVFFKGAVDDAAQFELQLDKVAAKGGYTAIEMEKLKNAAFEIGAKFGVSGTQAAEGLEILAAAGLKSSEAINTLPSVLGLAKSEAVSMDVAATKITDTLSIMGLGFNNAGRAADVLTKAANLSNTSAVGVADSIKYAGGIAKASGYSFEQAAAMIDVLANSGLKGEQAGTGLRSVLTSLKDPSSTASKELDKLGISTRDVGGVMDALKSKGKDANAAILGFGQEGAPAVYAFMEQGSAKIKEFTKELQNAGGASKETSDAMSSNFEGAKTRLSAAFDNLKIQLGSPILKPLTDSFDSLVAEFQRLQADGTLQKVGQSLADVFKSGGEWAVEFVKKTDFTTIGENIKTFAINISATFEEISSKAKSAGDVVNLVTGVFSAGFNTIQAAAGILEAAVTATFGGMNQMLGQVATGWGEIFSLVPGFGNVGESLKNVGSYMTQSGAAAIEFAKSLKDNAAQQMAEAGVAADKVQTAFKNLGDSASDSVPKLDKIWGVSEKLRETLGGIESKEISITADSRDAQAKVDNLKKPTEHTHTAIPDTQAAEQAKANLTTPTFSTHFVNVSYTDNGNGTANVGGRTVYHPTGSNYWGDSPQGYSVGGAIDFKRRKGKLDGYGGGDTVPAYLEAGEFIMRKEAVAMYGTGFMAQLNSMQIQDVPHFSTGGTVLERNMQTGGWDYDYQKWLMRAPRDELFTYPMPTWDPPTASLLAEHNKWAKIAIDLKAKQDEKEKVDVAKKEADTKTQSTPSQRPIADLIVSGSTNVPAPAPIPVITTIPVPTPEPIKIGTSSVAPIQAINPVASKPVTKVETTPVTQQVISNSAVPIYKSNNAAEKAAQDAKTEEESQKQKISQIRAKILDASGVEFETYNFEAIKQQQEEIRNLESEVNRLNPLILKGEDKKKNGGYDAERLIKIGDEAKAKLPDAIKAKQAAEQKLQAMIEQNQLVSKTESAAQKQAEAVVKQAQITKDAQQKLQEPDTSWHPFQEKPLPNYKVPPSSVPETNLKSEPTPVPTPVSKTQPQAQQQAQSNQIITIRFELPSGKTAQGSFTQNDSTNLINILKEAASRGLPANIG